MIDSKEFKKAITILSSVIRKQETFLDDICIKFTGTEAIAFNGSIFVQTPLHTQCDHVVDGRPLIAWGKSVNRDVSVVTKSDYVLFRSGRRSCRCYVRPAYEAEIKAVQWDEEPVPVDQTLVTAMKNCSMFADKVDMATTLQDIYLTQDHVFGASPYAIFKQTLVNQLPEDALFPVDALTLVNKLQPSEIGITEQWTNFMCEDGTRIAVRRPEGVYPPIHTQCPEGLPKFEIPADLNKELASAKQIMGDDFQTGCVRIKFLGKRGVIEISGRSGEVTLKFPSKIEKQIIQVPAEPLMLASKLFTEAHLGDGILIMKQDDKHAMIALQ